MTKHLDGQEKNGKGFLLEPYEEWRIECGAVLGNS